jgi:hypothetical protein
MNVCVFTNLPGARMAKLIMLECSVKFNLQLRVNDE